MRRQKSERVWIPLPVPWRGLCSSQLLWFHVPCSFPHHPCGSIPLWALLFFVWKMLFPIKLAVHVAGDSYRDIYEARGSYHCVYLMKPRVGYMAKANKETSFHANVMVQHCRSGSSWKSRTRPQWEMRLLPEKGSLVVDLWLSHVLLTSLSQEWRKGGKQAEQGL